MNLEAFFRKRLVLKTTPDAQLAAALLSMAEKDLAFLARLPVDDSSARKITVNYYDTLRSVLEAVAARRGYKVYSHEAFAALLTEDGHTELAQMFDRLRRVRNGINYYGKSIGSVEAQEHKKNALQLIKNVKMTYKEQLR